MNFKQQISLFLLFACSVFKIELASAQDFDLKDRIAEDLIEAILETAEEDVDVDNNTFLEDLYALMDQNLDINKVDRYQLEDLDFLTSFEIESILRYREQYGDLKSIYELQGVYGLSRTKMLQLAAIFNVGNRLSSPKIPLKQQFTKGKHQIFLRYQQVLENQSGYDEPEPKSDGSLPSHYTGNAAKLYARYRYQFSNKLSYGITLEKDPGEQLFNKDAKLRIDYVSAHFYMRDVKFIKDLVVGDYEVNFGQGLISAQGFGGRKSVDVFNIKAKGRTLKPHTSANEANFFRGAGLRLGDWKGLNFTVFGSHRQRDAAIPEQVVNEEDLLIVGSDGEVEEIESGSLQITGLHRTPSEIANRNSVNQLTFGGSVKWQKGRFALGANTIYTKLSTPVSISPRTYQKFEFNGDELINASLDYNYLYNRVHFYGETAISDNGGFGTTNGLLIRGSSGVSIAINHRYFTRDFQTLYATVFAESNRLKPSNENGLYVGISFSPFKNAKLDTYFDFYQHKWIKSSADAPSKGAEFLSQFSYKPTRRVELYVRGKYEIKQQNTPDNLTREDYLSDKVRGALRFHTSYSPSSNFKLKSRVEFSWAKRGELSPQTKGFLIYQDFGYTIPSGNFSMNARLALFDSEDFESAIYAYENTILYDFSVPAYSGRGIRYYVLFKYELNRYISFWARFAQTRFTGNKSFIPNIETNSIDVVESVSSGLNGIDGNTRSDIKLQMRIKF